MFMRSQVQLQTMNFIGSSSNPILKSQNIDFTSPSFLHKSPDKESRNFMFTSPRHLTEYGPGFSLWPHKAKT